MYKNKEETQDMLLVSRPYIALTSFLIIALAVHSSISTPAILQGSITSSDSFIEDFSTDPYSNGRWQIFRQARDLGIWTNGEFYLTRDVRWQSSIMFAQYSLTIRRWEATFRYRSGGRSNGACGDQGGDGIFFFFYSNSFVPGPGRIGIPNEGYSVKLDTYTGRYCDIVPGELVNYVAVKKNKDPYNSVLKAMEDSRVEDNQWHKVDIRFDNGRILVSIDGDLLIDYQIESPDYSYSTIGFHAITGDASNDQVIDDFSIGPVLPFLELPFDYTAYSTFNRAVSDTERGGAVSSYFDHRYPTYGGAPNSTYTGTVTFHGFDSTTDRPGFKLSYDGHNGIDFAVRGQNVQVLAAADGTIADIVPARSGSCLGNHIVMTYTNGFTTTYAHLASFSDNIREGQTVRRGTPLGVMGSTGCSTGPHIHFQVTNPAGIAVNPFGWTPFPNSAYGRSGDEDPWRAYNQSRQPPVDGTSHYLWIHPLSWDALNNPDTSAVVHSVSGEVTATFPVAAYTEPYRIELWDSLNSPEMVEAISTPLSTFALYAYNRNKQPIWSLLKPVQIRFKLRSMAQAAAQATSLSPEYRIYHWNDTTREWRALPTSYDAQTGLISAPSYALGRFAVIQVGHATFLPLVTRGQ